MGIDVFMVKKIRSRGMQDLGNVWVILDRVEFPVLPALHEPALQ